MATVIDYSQALVFFLLLVRVSSILFLIPIFGDVQVPPSIKILFAVSVTVFFTHVVPPQTVDINAIGTFEICWFSIKEFVLGLIIGFLFRIAFFVVAGAADAIAQTSGFSASRMFNPHTGEDGETVLGQLLFLLVVLMFFSTGCDVVLMRVIHRVITDIPLGHLRLDANVMKAVLSAGALVIELAVRIAGPLLFCLVLINLGMGLMGRLVPTLNVMAMSFTVTLFATIWLMWLFLPVYVSSLDSVFGVTERLVFEMIGGLSG